MSNVSYRVTFSHGWCKVDDLEQLAEYLGDEAGHYFYRAVKAAKEALNDGK